MARVVVVGPSPPFRGGISYHTTLLFRHLRRRVPQAHMYSWWRQYPAWLFPGRDDRDPSAQPLDEPGIARVLDGWDPRTFLALGRRLRATRPELLIVPWWVAYWAPHVLLLLRAARARRVAFVVHNAREHEDSWLRRRIARLVLSHGDRLLVHSAGDAEALAELVPGRELVIGYHPSYEEIAPPAPPREHARAELARRYGVPERGPLVLFFGFVRPYKGLPDLVEALARLATPAHLLVAGEFWGPERLALDQQRARLPQLAGRITVVDRFLPAEDIPACFAGSELVVLPYRSGTGSGILQTAYAYDCPVVATRVGSLADAVRDGVTGWLVPPGDPGALAAAIDVALADRAGAAARRAEIARERRERFGWDGLVERLIAGLV